MSQAGAWWLEGRERRERRIAELAEVMRRAAASQPWPVPRDGALAVPLCDERASDAVQAFQAARAQIGREHYGVELVDAAGRSHLVDALQEIGDCWRYLAAEAQLRARTGRETAQIERMEQHADVLLHALADAVVEQWVGERAIHCEVVDTLDAD